MLLESVVGSYTYFADGDVLLAKITPCFENGKSGIANGLNNHQHTFRMKDRTRPSRVIEP